MLDNVSTIKGEDTYKSCVGLKELITTSDTDSINSYVTLFCFIYWCFEVPGVIGTLQALEAIKIIVGIKCILSSSLSVSIFFVNL